MSFLFHAGVIGFQTPEWTQLSKLYIHIASLKLINAVKDT